MTTATSATTAEAATAARTVKAATATATATAAAAARTVETATAATAARRRFTVTGNHQLARRQLTGTAVLLKLEGADIAFVQAAETGLFDS